MVSDAMLVDEFRRTFCDNLLQKWYPLVIDRDCGGYFTNITFDWKLSPEQEKMVVTQARHIWTLAATARFLDEAPQYEQMARHGYGFLRQYMWDQEYGGFYQIRSRTGGMSDVRGWRDEKRAYGNAFGVYALAALYRLTHDPEVLAFAQKAFEWIEGHAFDPKHKGYFQFLTREGKPFDLSSDYKTIACDGNEVGYKDQNSSIHLLEAYTELYHVWKDPKLEKQLQSLLTLIRDTMVTKKGYLQLFFYPDWSPVTFRDSAAELRQANYGLDHVSFGHDYETAFLMLEASYVLRLKNDSTTLRIAKNMLDHALHNGWDKERGGFFDGGYYFRGEERCTIIRETKNWWAQAEALNALLLFSRIFPDETRYYEFFLREWEYIKQYVLDKEHGDWFWGGIDKEPHLRMGPKSDMWKCTYHTGRALMNCMGMFSELPEGIAQENFRRRKEEVAAFVDHWRETARLLGE